MPSHIVLLTWPDGGVTPGHPLPEPPPGHPSHPIVLPPVGPDNTLPEPPPGIPVNLPVFPPPPGVPVGPDQKFKLRYSPLYGWVIVPVRDETAEPK